MEGTIILITVLTMIFCGLLAKHQNRRPLLWVFLGFLIPILPLVVLYFLPTIEEEEKDE